MQSKALYDEFEIQSNFSDPQYKMKIGVNPQGQYFLLVFLDEQDRQSLELEHFTHIQAMDHPSLLSLKQVRVGGLYTKQNGTSQLRSCLIYEYPQVELFEYLHQTGKFNEIQARLYFRQILDGIMHYQLGLIYIHKQGHFHGDLVVENIYFKDACTVKIGEYGFYSIKRRTLEFSTPEWNTLNEQYPKSRDIFCLGMILFSLVVGSPPFSKTDKTQLYYKAFYQSPENFWNKILQKVPTISAQLKDLIHGMLAEEPQGRYSLSEIYSHSWTNVQSDFTPYMIKEFSLKQEKIAQCIIKAKLLNQLIKQQKAANHITSSKLQTGIGKLYKSEVKEYEKREQQLENIDRNRKIKNLNSDLVKADSYFIHLDPYLIHILLEENLNPKNSEFSIVKQNNFKLIVSCEENEILIKVELVQIEQEVICVTFKKVKGDMFNYIEKVRQFHKLIDNMLSVVLNE